MALIDDNWAFQVDKQEIKQFYHKFQENLNGVSARVLKLMDDGFQSNHLNFKEDKSLNNKDMDLKCLIEKNKVLKEDLDKKMQEIAKNQVQYEGYKKDRKLLSQEIKETHEAFLMAKKYYKKFLRMYYTIESTNNNIQIIFVQFFTENKKDNENFSVRLSRDIASGNYKLIETTPQLKTFSEMQKKLQETKDVPGALSYIRQSFLKLKQNK